MAELGDLSSKVFQGDSNPINKINDVAAAQRDLASGEPTFESVDDVTGQPGDQVGGRFISPDASATSSEPTDTGFTGAFQSGRGETFSGILYQFGAVIAGVLGAGFNTAGQLLAGVGAVVIDVTGIAVTGLLTALKFTATIGSNTRELSVSLQPNGSGDTPIGGVYYRDPNIVASNLITLNPGLEAGDLSGVTVTGAVYSNSTDYASSGTHSLKQTVGSGTAKFDRYAISAGSIYDATVKIRATATVSGVFLVFYNAVSGGSSIGSRQLTKRADALVNGFSSYGSFSVLAPVGATHATIEITASGTEVVYYDDFNISLATLTNSATFEPEFTVRKNGIKQDKVFAKKVFTPNILVCPTSGVIGSPPVMNRYLLPGGTLKDNGFLRIVNRGTILNQTGSNQTIQFIPTLGSGNVGSETLLTIATSTVERGYVYEIVIGVDPNTAGNVMAHEILTVESGTLGADNVFVRKGTSRTVDVTADNYIALAAVPGVASGLLQILSQYVSVEYLPGTDATSETYTWRSQPDASTGNDTYIESGAATTNHGTSVIIAVGESNAAVDVTRTLIKFPLPTLPATAVITSARLRIFFGGDASTNARDYKIYRVLRNWVTLEATWNVWKSGNNWTTAGCSGAGTDYDSTVLATTNVAATNTLDTVCDFSIDVTEITNLVNGTHSNFGFLIKADTELNDQWAFPSSDEATKVSEHPILEITYTIPPTGNE